MKFTWRTWLGACTTIFKSAVGVSHYLLQAVEFQGWIKLELDDDVVDIDDLEDDVLEILDCFNYELFPNAAYVASTVKNAMVLKLYHIHMFLMDHIS